jgi:hypothetical protein
VFVPTDPALTHASPEVLALEQATRAAKAVERNGAAEPSAAHQRAQGLSSSPSPSLSLEGPRLPRRLAWFDLPEEYGEAGFRVRLWVNCPKGFVNAILDPAVSEEETIALLCQVVVETNGWCDERGRPYPLPTSEQFWVGEQSVPTELTRTIVAVLVQAPSALPNMVYASLRPNGRR